MGRSPQSRAYIKERIEKIDLQLTALYDSMTKSLPNAGTESYGVDTGQMMQRKKNRDLSKTLKDIRDLEILRASLLQQYAGTDIVNFTYRPRGR